MGFSPSLSFGSVLADHQVVYCSPRRNSDGSRTELRIESCHTHKTLVLGHPWSKYWFVFFFSLKYYLLKIQDFFVASPILQAVLNLAASSFQKRSTLFLSYSSWDSALVWTNIHSNPPNGTRRLTIVFNFARKLGISMHDFHLGCFSCPKGFFYLFFYIYICSVLFAHQKIQINTRTRSEGTNLYWQMTKRWTPIKTSREAFHCTCNKFIPFSRNER